MKGMVKKMKFAKITAAALSAILVGAQIVSCGSKDKSGDGYDYSKGLDSNGFFTGVKASDYVELPEYKGIDIDASILEASEEDIQAQLDGIISQSGSYEKITDRAVEDGDTINIDYVGSVDGVEFQGGSTGGQGTNVTIGVTNYIDDFLEQLIGHKPGENFDIEVTFPTNYGKEDLNGKDAIFNVTINYICGEPLLTDEVAMNYGFSSVEDLMADLKQWLIDNQKMKMFNNLLGKATLKGEVPQAVLDYVIDYDIEQQTLTAQYQYGVTLEELLSEYGFASKEAYIESLQEDYKDNALRYLAAQAIAENEGLSVSDADLEAEGYSEEEINTYGKPYLKQYTLFKTVIPNFIIENGIVK